MYKIVEYVFMDNTCLFNIPVFSEYTKIFFYSFFCCKNFPVLLIACIRGLSKKLVEFVNKNQTTIPIAFKFVL